MAPVHRLKHPVGSGLHRKMEVRHQRRHIAVCQDQILFHVQRMRGGVAEPLKTINLGKFADQAGEAPDAAIRRFTVIGVHILPEKRQLTASRGDKTARFFHDAVHRPRKFRAAGVGHHTEGAELVAAFLHREEGRRTTRCMLARKLVELDFFRKIRVDGAFARCRIGAADKLGKAVIGLWTDNNVNPGGAAGDFLAFSLGHTASDRNGDAASLLVTGAVFHHPQSAKFGEHLFRRLFADMAGVEDDHVGPLGITSRRIAKRRKHVGHAVGIIDIHLAPVGLDEQLLCHDRGSLLQAVVTPAVLCRR